MQFSATIAPGVADLLTATQWAAAERKISQFRRHPDWRKAFDKVVPQFRTTLPDGRPAVHEEDVKLLFEMADQEFIEEIIRNGY